jgi:membrane carboxypeptidase/penicillin-binding protein
MVLSFLGLSSCGTLKGLFTAQDATAAIRELLSFGTEHGGNLLGKNGAFTKDALMQSILPKDVDKVINVLETLGLGKEVNRFTTTLATAAEKTAEKSVPIFLQGIKRMDIGDAFGIVKNGGTACTDYLRNKIGDTLRRAVAPEMNKALDEYKLAKQWNDLVAPAKLLLGDKLNLDLGNLMSGLVTNAMFAKIEEKEREIRTKAQARNTALLQKVFGQIVK